MLPTWLTNLFMTSQDREVEGSRGGFAQDLMKSPAPMKAPAMEQNISSAREDVQRFAERQPTQAQPAPDDEELLNSLRLLASIAQEAGMPPELLIAQFFQESSFGKNPAINEENSATALGPMQITRPFTEDTPAYPAYPELQIGAEERRELEPSGRFAANHFKRWRGITGSDEEALNRYYGDSTYAPKVMGHLQNPEIIELMRRAGINQ